MKIILLRVAWIKRKLNDFSIQFLLLSIQNLIKRLKDSIKRDPVGKFQPIQKSSADYTAVAEQLVQSQTSSHLNHSGYKPFNNVGNTALYSHTGKSHFEFSMRIKSGSIRGSPSVLKFTHADESLFCNSQVQLFCCILEWQKLFPCHLLWGVW